MIAKEKALDLVWCFAYLNFDVISRKEIEKSKKSSLKLCEEMIELNTINASMVQCVAHVKYWREVKKEIELL